MRRQPRRRDGACAPAVLATVLCPAPHLMRAPLPPSLHNSANFPIIAITLRNNLKQLLTRKDKPFHPTFDRFFFPLIAIGPPILVAFFTENVKFLVSFTGSYGEAEGVRGGVGVLPLCRRSSTVVRLFSVCFFPRSGCGHSVRHSHDAAAGGAHQATGRARQPRRQRPQVSRCAWAGRCACECCALSPGCAYCSPLTALLSLLFSHRLAPRSSRCPRRSSQDVLLGEDLAVHCAWLVLCLHCARDLQPRLLQRIAIGVQRYQSSAVRDKRRLGMKRGLVRDEKGREGGGEVSLASVRQRDGGVTRGCHAHAYMHVYMRSMGWEEREKREKKKREREREKEREKREQTTADAVLLSFSFHCSSPRIQRVSNLINAHTRTHAHTHTHTRIHTHTHACLQKGTTADATSTANLSQQVLRLF